MLASQDCLRSGNHYNRLGVVDNHSRPFHYIADLQIVEQENGGIVDSPHLVEVNTVLRVYLCAVIDILFLERLDFCVNRLAESIESLSDAPNLLQYRKQHVVGVQK